MPTIQGDTKQPAALAILLTLTTLLFTGCFDTKQEITLNPDGSGKVVIESVFQQITPFLTGRTERDQASNITNIVRGIIESSEGVEVWRDISFHQRADGRGFFRGTAYFRSLNKLKLPLTGNQRWTAARDFSSNLTITVLGMVPSENTITKTNEPVTAESIRRERAQLQALRPLIHTTVGESRQEITLRIPGTLVHSTNFDTNAPRILRLVTDGKRTVAAMEDRMFDPVVEARRIAGEKFDSWDDQMMKAVYGEAGPVRAVIRLAQSPRFDFEKEVAAARVDLVTSDPFGLTEMFPSPLKPARDGAPATVKVVGVQSKQGTGSGLGTLDSSQTPFFEMTLEAELPGEIFSTSKAVVNRAITKEGMSLKDISRPHNSRLGSGRTNVHFIVRLTPPPEQSEGFAEISGHLECIGPESLQIIELAAGKLRGGTRGRDHGVLIEDVVPNFSGGDKLLLRTTIKPERLRSPRVVGKNGVTVALQNRKQEAFGDDYVYTLANPYGIPRTGKIVAEVLTGELTLKIPFALTNVSLLGQPLTR